MRIRQVYGRTFSAGYQSVEFSTAIEIEVPDEREPGDDELEVLFRRAVNVSRKLSRRVVEEVEQGIDAVCENDPLVRDLVRSGERKVPRS